MKKNLVLVSSKDRQTKIFPKAKELNDRSMMMKVGVDAPVDMIAMDFRYHRICMTTYLNRKTGVATDGDMKPKREEAIDILVSEIKDNILRKKAGYYSSNFLAR